MTSSRPRNLEGQDVGEAARRSEAASGNHGNAAAHRLGVGEDVRAEEHRAPLIAQLQDQRAHVAAAERVEARHGFVQKDDFRVVQERLRNADALDHALRCFRSCCRRRSGRGPRGRGALPRACGIRAGKAEQPRKVLEELFGAQIVVEVRILRRVADPLARRDVASRAAEISARPDVEEIGCISSLSVVVFPAPFGPRKPKISPLCTSSDRRSSASTAACARSRPNSPW